LLFDGGLPGAPDGPVLPKLFHLATFVPRINWFAIAGPMIVAVASPSMLFVE